METRCGKKNLKTPLFIITYWQHVTLPLVWLIDINWDIFVLICTYSLFYDTRLAVVSVFKRMPYYQRHGFSKNQTLAVQIIAAWTEFPFPGPTSNYNNFKPDVQKFIKFKKSDWGLTLFFCIMEKFSGFFDLRLIMPIQWNGWKENRERQVKSAKYFNDHIYVIVHTKRYIKL